VRLTGLGPFMSMISYVRSVILLLSPSGLRSGAEVEFANQRPIGGDVMLTPADAVGNDKTAASVDNELVALVLGGF
jgi:hypothetical protein